MSTAMSESRRKLLFLAQFSMLLAIEAIVCFTPLGSLPIGPLVATLSHIPVIMTAILLGPGAGAAMGFAFGLFSFLVWTFMPPSPVVAFAFTPFYSLGEFQGNFWSIIICFVPRILIGVVTGLTFALFKKLLGKYKYLNAFIYGLSGLLGSLTNTFLVLGGIYVFFGEQYATVNGTTKALLIGAFTTVILTNGLLEAALGAVFGYGVCRPVKLILEKRKMI